MVVIDTSEDTGKQEREGNGMESPIYSASVAVVITIHLLV